ncbi:ATP-binding cassette domain-containing protein [Litorisediminicola beolgyonensis]|uniref:ATP-binding cassette domain-containing protein n=1 Tax=Litorisediminicola beolgyonensis TaxID=1173614 RepID=A0ABW3ZFY9_9RHOB
MSDVATCPASLAAAPATRAVLPLSVRGLSLRLGGAQVLDRVDLTLGARGCTVILGPNGAGKSVLLKLLHGLMMPDAGSIRWGDLDPVAARPRQAMVFQTPVLLRRSVAANLDFVLRARGLDRSRRDALLSEVGLSHKARQPARKLSGGEAQRLALARALATDPEILLLDEPSASLDPASTLAIEEIVQSCRRTGRRVFLVTHDIGQARRIADDIVFLHHGRVLAHQPAQEFFSAPERAEARDYLAGKLIL